MWIRAVKDFVSESVNIKAGNVTEVSLAEGRRILGKGNAVEIEFAEAMRQITGEGEPTNRIDLPHTNRPPAITRKETRR